MARDLQTRFFAVILALLSVAAVVFAWINFQKDREFSPPTTAYGGWKKVAICWPSGWTSTVPARRRESSRATAWLRWMDTTSPMSAAWSVSSIASESGPKANYSLVRQGVPLEAPLIPAPADRRLYGGLRLIALVYLGIGLYVLLRRWTAPRSTHFYIFCLVSFIFYSFHYTGKLNDFDWIVYWSNVVAGYCSPRCSCTSRWCSRSASVWSTGVRG